MVETNEEVWFVLLQGEELGPMSFQEVLDFYYKDVVTSESLLWREGWNDWISIVQVPEFNELLFQGAIIQPAPEEENPAHAGEDTAFISEDQLRQSVLLAHESYDESVDISLDGDFYDLDDLEELEELEDLDELSKLISHPSDSSSKISGVSHVPTQASDDSYQVLNAQDLSQSIARLNQSSPSLRQSHLNLTPIRVKRKSRLPMLFGVLLLLGGLVGGGLTYFPHIFPFSLSNQTFHETRSESATLPLPGSNAVEHQPAMNVPTDQGLPIPRLTNEVLADQENDQPVAPSPSTVDQEDDLSASLLLQDAGLVDELPDSKMITSAQLDQSTTINAPSLDQSPSSPQNPGSIGLSSNKKTTPEIDPPKIKPPKIKPPKVKPPKIKSTATKSPRLKRKRPPRKKVVVGKIVKNEPIPQTLARKDFERVINQNQTKLKTCAQQDTSLKAFTIQVIIQRNGSVSSVSPISYKLRKSPAQKCILSVARGFRFPKYTGDLIRTNLPIKL